MYESFYEYAWDKYKKEIVAGAKTRDQRRGVLIYLPILINSKLIGLLLRHNLYDMTREDDGMTRQV